jgi:hypothetical protein
MHALDLVRGLALDPGSHELARAAVDEGMPQPLGQFPEVSRSTVDERSIISRPSRGARSWDLHLADAADGRALGDVGGEQPERFGFALGFDRPPDRVSAGAARGEGWTVAKWALVSSERGEDDSALLRLVAVLE